MSEDKRCQDGTRCGGDNDDGGKAIVRLSVDHTVEPTQPARVPQPSATENHLFHRKAGGAVRYSLGEGGATEESDGFVCPELPQRPGEAAGRVRRPTWEVAPSGRRPRGKRSSRSR